MKVSHRTPCDGDVRDRGAAMVELALILPILLMLLVGIINFGLAYSAQVSIQGAAREGARALALSESSAAVDLAARNAAGSAHVTAVKQTACPVGSSSTSTAYATVTVTANYVFGIPFVSLGSTTFSATARMRCGL